MSLWAICRGETEVCYTETIYPPDSVADHGLILCKYRCYARIAEGVLYRDATAQRCYEEST